MSDRPLEYAPPRPRRLRWPLLLLIVSALAVGWVGKLCWDRFSGPAARHWTQIRAQEQLRQSPAGAVDSVAAGSNGDSLSIGRPYVEDPTLAKRSAAVVGQAGGPILYHGPLGSPGRERFVRVTLNLSPFEPAHATTLVVRLFTVGSTWTPVSEVGKARFFRLPSFRRALRVNPPTRPPDQLSTLILTGHADDVPFRFELIVDGDNDTRLVEVGPPPPPSDATPSPP